MWFINVWIYFVVAGFLVESWTGVRVNWVSIPTSGIYSVSPHWCVLIERNRSVCGLQYICVYIYVIKRWKSIECSSFEKYFLLIYSHKNKGGYNGYVTLTFRLHKSRIPYLFYIMILIFIWNILRNSTLKSYIWNVVDQWNSLDGIL